MINTSVPVYYLPADIKIVMPYHNLLNFHNPECTIATKLAAHETRNGFRYIFSVMIEHIEQYSI